MKIVTADQMRAMEREAHAAGMAYETMMDRAGRAVSSVVVDVMDRAQIEDQSVLVLVGPGNNGGDGLVAARELAREGREVFVHIWRRAADCPLLQAAMASGAAIAWLDDDPSLEKLAGWARRAGGVVDALLGTGAQGPLRGRLPDMFTCVDDILTARRARPQSQVVTTASPDLPLLRGSSTKTPIVIAVDMPSGMDADTGEADPRILAADMTVTFAAPKPGHFHFPGAVKTGRLLVADIGLGDGPDDAPILLDAGFVAEWMPKRSPSSHKGTYGKAMVVAGSTNYVGAPALAAEAAYRAGAGLVTLGVPSAVYPLVASRLREATYLLLGGQMGALSTDSIPLLAEKLAGYNALLVGPGLGDAPATGEFIDGLLNPQRAPRRGLGYRTSQIESPAVQLPPTVIDADGLNHLSKRDAWWRMLPEQCVLTPHPGEMARLTGFSTADLQANRWALARESAKKWGCVVVLKGAYTVIAMPDDALLVSPFATSALAVAGSGDVLAGMIAGLMAQGLGPLCAAGAAVYLHGLAGMMMEDRVGSAGGLASELLPIIPQAMYHVRENTAPFGAVLG